MTYIPPPQKKKEKPELHLDARIVGEILTFLQHLLTKLSFH